MIKALVRFVGKGYKYLSFLSVFQPAITFALEASGYMQELGKNRIFLLLQMFTNKSPHVFAFWAQSNKKLIDLKVLLNVIWDQRFIGKAAIYLANVTLTFLLINRWIVSGHFPLSNLYESLLFLSWSFTSIFSIASFTLPENTLPIIGSSIAPIALLTCSFAFFCIPQELQKAQPLVPALQSNWLIMHVSVMILSYASLLLGSLFALGLLLAGHFSESFAYFGGTSENDTCLIDYPSEVSSQGNPSNSAHKEKKVIKTNILDNLSYRFIGFGFSFLTLGLISGAVWANFAWGSYWSWDPKETWAFITWLTYAIYLHLRISKGWYGEQSAFVAIFGFFVVWFCYLGVNLFGKGLHSYAFV